MPGRSATPTSLWHSVIDVATETVLCIHIHGNGHQSQITEDANVLRTNREYTVLAREINLNAYFAEAS